MHYMILAPCLSNEGLHSPDEVFPLVNSKTAKLHPHFLLDIPLDLGCDGSYTFSLLLDQVRVADHPLVYLLYPAVYLVQLRLVLLDLLVKALLLSFTLSLECLVLVLGLLNVLHPLLELLLKLFIAAHVSLELVELLLPLDELVLSGCQCVLISLQVANFHFHLSLGLMDHLHLFSHRVKLLLHFFTALNIALNPSLQLQVLLICLVLECQLRLVSLCFRSVLLGDLTQLIQSLRVLGRVENFVEDLLEICLV